MWKQHFIYTLFNKVSLGMPYFLDPAFPRGLSPCISWKANRLWKTAFILYYSFQRQGASLIGGGGGCEKIQYTYIHRHTYSFVYFKLVL